MQIKRHTIFTLVIVGLSLGAASLYGQKKGGDETPSLLYQVKGKGITKPSYIFGTFHAVCPTEMVPFESLDVHESVADATAQLQVDGASLHAAEVRQVADGYGPSRRQVRRGEMDGDFRMHSAGLLVQRDGC